MRHFILSVCLLIASLAFAQPRQSKIQLLLVPNHSDALYHVNEKASVKVVATNCGMALNDITIDYQVSQDLMSPHISNSITLTGNEATIEMGTMSQPGFLRIKATTIVDGKFYSSMATIGFDTHEIKPVTILPDDFASFWKQQVESARKLPLSPTMTRLNDRCTPEVDVYHISYANVGGSKMYGMLTMPSAPGKYPAILRLPGAGVGEKSGDIAHAAQGAIVLEMGIHGIPVNLSPSIYSDLGRSALAAYHTYNCDNRYSYYYKQVYLGCVRAVDFLLSLPQCNGNVGTHGGSQGGALSVAVSALHPDVKATAVYFPALSDMEGYMHNRAGGWPHLLKNQRYQTEAVVTTLRYFDTANFAQMLSAPVFYAYGYNDITCAPTTTTAVYNVIKAPKTISIGQNTGHWLYPEQTASMWQWIIDMLQSK